MIIHEIKARCPVCVVGITRQYTHAQVEDSRFDLPHVNREMAVAAIRNTGCDHDIEITERMFDRREP